MYTSELARHQDRAILFGYNLGLSYIFGAVNTLATTMQSRAATSGRPSPYPRKEDLKDLIFISWPDIFRRYIPSSRE